MTANRQVAVLAAVVAALALGLWFKAPLVRLVTPGDTLVVELARDYKLTGDRSAVKLAGVPVGVVTGVAPLGDAETGGPVAVELDLDPGTLELLGDTPTAQVRPTTVLGGSYYVSLVPGGDRAATTDRIPLDRSRTPVELDLLLSAVPPDAQSSAQAASRLFDDTLHAGAGDALGRVLQAAPGTLGPAAGVLDAARGTRPADLTELVTDLRALAAAATEREGQLPAVVDGFAGTAAALAHSRDAVAAAVGTLPETLDATRAGADDARATLERLAVTARDLDDTAAELDPLLAELDPALDELRPLLAELRPVLGDARPLVRDLVPVAEHGTEVLDDVRGPVLDRVRGPILDALDSEFHGVGDKYPQSTGSGHPLYEELGYLATGINGGVKTFNGNGSMISFQVGIGTSTLRNAPGEEIVARLAELAGGHR